MATKREREIIAARARNARALERANREIQRSVTNGRRELFARLSEYDSGLARRLERQAARARREINAIAGLSRGERNRRIASLVRRRMHRLLREEEGRIASAVLGAAERGVEAGNLSAQAAQRMSTVVAGENAPALLADVHAAANSPSFTRALVQRPRLSRALRRNARATSERFAVQLQLSMDQGEGVIAAANRLLSVEDPIVHLPRYVEDLQAAARIGHPGEIRLAGRNALRAARQLGLRDPKAALNLRNSAAQLARAARSGMTEDVNRQINYFIQEKARYQARRVARTEMSRSFNSAYVQSVQASPSVKGMKWQLSTSHPMPDVCDMYASVDIAGLGSGVYPNDALQQIPAHPHCLCYYTAEMRTPQEIASGQDAPRGRAQSYQQWLNAQPRTAQESILGPGRTREFRRGGAHAARVVSRDGQLSPLYRVQRRPAPARRMGTRVDVRRTVGDLLPPRTDGT